MKPRHIAAGLGAILALATAVPALGSSTATNDGASHGKLVRSSLVPPAGTLGAQNQSTASDSSESDAEVSYWGDMSKTEKAEALWYSSHCTFTGPNGEGIDEIEGEMLPSLAPDAPDSGMTPSVEVQTHCRGQMP